MIDRIEYEESNMSAQERNKTLDKLAKEKGFPDYRAYRQPSLFPEGLKRKRITKAIYRRRTKAKRIRSESDKNMDKPVQFCLDLS